MTAPEAVAVADGDEDRTTREAALDIGPEAQILISRSGQLTFANVAARALLGIAEDEIGSAFAEHPVASEPVELQDAVAKAMREHRRVPSGRSSSGRLKASRGA